MDEVVRRVNPLLAIVLAAVAQDRNCSEDDLSVGLVRALEDFGMGCYQQGYDAAYEEPTVKTHIVPLKDDKLPDGI